MGLHLGGIGTRITIIDQDVAAGRPSELPEALPETLKITLRVWVVLRDSQQYGDPPHLVALLRSRHERPRHGRAAEQGDELAPSHELPSEEARNLAHHWTMRAPCIAAKSFPLMSVQGSNRESARIGLMSASTGCGRRATGLAQPAG